MSDSIVVLSESPLHPEEVANPSFSLSGLTCSPIQILNYFQNKMRSISLCVILERM